MAKPINFCFFALQEFQLCQLSNYVGWAGTKPNILKQYIYIPLGYASLTQPTKPNPTNTIRGPTVFHHPLFTPVNSIILISKPVRFWVNSVCFLRLALLASPISLAASSSSTL